MTTNTSLNGIVRQLVNHGLVDEATALKAIEMVKSDGIETISAIIKCSDASPSAIAQYVASDFGLSSFDLSSLSLESVPPEFINEELLETQHAVPIAKRGSKLFLAISDPTNSEPIDKYKFSSGLSVEAVVVADDELNPEWMKHPLFATLIKFCSMQ